MHPLMTEPACETHSPDSLRALVRQKLCEPDFLDPDCYQITESLLIQRGQPCGLAYCLNGPRAVRLTAIWSTEEQMLYCYNSRGKRFLKTPVQINPAPYQQAA